MFSPTEESHIMGLEERGMNLGKTHLHPQGGDKYAHTMSMAPVSTHAMEIVN